MDVMMAVQVVKGQTRLQKCLDLSFPFKVDELRVGRLFYQKPVRVAERPVCFRKRVTRLCERPSPRQGEMDPDVQGRVRLRERDRFLDGIAVHDHCCRIDDALDVTVDDASVHTGRQPEVVGVNQDTCFMHFVRDRALDRAPGHLS